MTKKRIIKLFAVAGTDGLIVDQHFGHIEKLFIYSVSDNSDVKFVKAVNIDPYCSNGCKPEQKMKKLISEISDCSYILCLRIGHAPASQLKKAGIQPVETYGKIDEIIKAIIAKEGLNKIYRFV
jgi:nitrogen fixation protein NifB